MSYMSSHGYNTGRFIQKQGFDFVFVECENRMWRIGKRLAAQHFSFHDYFSCRTTLAFVKASLAVIYDSRTGTGNKNAVAKPFYFARKFESLVDIDAITLAEEQAMRDRPHVNTNDVMFNVTFVNHYKADIDGYSVPFSLMAESLLSMHSDESDFISLSRIDVVKMHSSAPHQMIFTMQSRSSATPLQLLVERKMVSNIVSPAITNGFKLEVIMAGMDIDHKEEFFRGITAYADLKSSPTVALRWSRVAGLGTTVNETKTSPGVRFTWRGPDQKAVATQRLRPYDSIRGMQFASLNLQKLNSTNLKPGMWNVVVQTDVEGSSEILASVWFPVYSTEDGALFRSLVRDFFTVKDSCSTNCSSTTWSTFHPDPKSDILIGYDKVTQTLV
ncbi:hypothetical protein TELCIR_04697 [Teladorsagia circumcincta]|uniref:Xylosyltransferase C-terminal domain-containing protein n=1 Tax=Teladorsagia circumcincta TaxID=45464 RepID=A0A2G9UUE7_TELCI|nr:hypothetical protein TELCIR_04697 [Teladorsagia circumcincta]